MASDERCFGHGGGYRLVLICARGLRGIDACSSLHKQHKGIDGDLSCVVSVYGIKELRYLARRPASTNLPSEKTHSARETKGLVVRTDPGPVGTIPNESHPP